MLSDVRNCLHLLSPRRRWQWVALVPVALIAASVEAVSGSSRSRRRDYVPGGLTSSNYTIAFVDGTLTVTSDPNGKMHGSGHIDEGRKHHHFVFRVSQRDAREWARLE